MPPADDVPAPLRAAADILSAPDADSKWRGEARPEQIAPAGEWFVWLIVAGRGWGKTRTGAEWLAAKALTTAGDYAVIGRSSQDTKETCIEGQSGLLRALGLRRDSREYNRASGQIRLANGSVIYAYSAERPERVRGPNLSGAWCDELAVYRFPQIWTETLMPALRIGNPQVVVTTTPKPRNPILRELVERSDGSVVTTRGSTFDNEKNLSSNALAELRRRYDGTRLGRQELYGELIADVEGALWSEALIEPHRVARVDLSEIRRIVVGVDPAVTSGEGSDNTGIIVAGLGLDGQAYVLDDLTCHLPPEQWARRVIFAFEKWGADRVVVEANQGRDLLETVLRAVDPTVPIKSVNAARGKFTRAEPVAAYYEQGHVHHVGAFAELEDEMCQWVPGERSSPDRLDALVWALTELSPGAVSVLAPIFATGTSRWAPLTQRAGGW